MYPSEWGEEGGIVRQYRVWFNRQAELKDAWVVQEVTGDKATICTAPGVLIHGACQTKTDLTHTPQGWVEAAGQLSRDGTTNFVVIR